MATQAVTLENTRERITALEKEVSALRIRLATEESELAALQSERAGLAEKIALGEAPASKATALARRIEEAETRVAGFRSLIAGKQPCIDELWGTVRHEEEEARQAAAVAEVTGHEEEGLAALDAIEKHFTAAASDFERLAEARKKLEHHAKDGLWAPMRGHAVPVTAQRANQALAAFGERLRVLITRTGWMPTAD